MNEQWEQECRRTVLAEVIAEALHSIAATMSATYEKQYPTKKEPHDAVVTHRLTEEERLRQEQGDTGESDEEWAGRRETQFVADEARKAKRP